MPFPPLPRAEAERHRIRPSCLLLLTGLLLLAGGDIAFADTAADANAAYQRGDYATAIELFRSLAEQGDTAAQYAIGNMYDKGEGVLRDKNEANKWWYRAALHGSADALRKFENIRCEKLYPRGKGAIPGVNCLNDAGNNYDLLTKPDQTAPPKPIEPGAAQRAQSRLQRPIRRMQARQRSPIVPRKGRGSSCRCSVKKACSSWRPR